MKKWILSAAFILAINGLAAAQSTPARDTTQKEKSHAKKGMIQKKTLNPSIKKHEDNRETVAHPAKLKVALPAVDTIGVPVKRKQ